MQISPLWASSDVQLIWFCVLIAQLYSNSSDHICAEFEDANNKNLRRFLGFVLTTRSVNEVHHQTVIGVINVGTLFYILGEQ